LAGAKRMSTNGELADRPLRVLLVEDNPEDAFLLERHLQRAGYAPALLRVETAEAMLRALESKTEDWDIILADYNLPAFSAPAALRLLKTNGSDVPFIVMSGAISEETAVAAMRAGAHDYISKQNLARLVPAIEREMTEAAGRRHKRAAEHALQLSEQRFHRLVEAMPLALIIGDATGRIEYANEAIERLLGYSQDDVARGELTLDKILGDNSDGSSPWDEFWSPEGCEPCEVECLTREGTIVPVLLGCAVLNPHALPDRRQFAAFLADLTEQRRSHEVLRRTEKLAAAGRLAASIAHEINNPLEAVTNCLYLLTQSTMDDTGRQYLSLAQRELERVVHIATQTLRFYRQSTRPIETDVHELIETVLALFDARIRSHGIEVVRKFGDIPHIRAFDGEVRQVIANLIGNAIDAMQSAGGSLRLHTRRARDWRTGNDGVSITIVDTGIGMSRATLQRIYEPFFSTKGTTGTGLGLWVSREIVNKHQGFTRVRSREGEASGTVFRVFLPSHAAHNLDQENGFLRASA
jgi:PAS domain S-box-containing protein